MSVISYLRKVIDHLFAINYIISIIYFGIISSHIVEKTPGIIFVQNLTRVKITRFIKETNSSSDLHSFTSWLRDSIT